MHFASSLQKKNYFLDMFMNNLKYRMNVVILKIHLQTVYTWVSNKDSSLINICQESWFFCPLQNLLHGRENEDLLYLGGAKYPLNLSGMPRWFFCSFIFWIGTYFTEERSAFSFGEEYGQSEILWCGSPGAGLYSPCSLLGRLVVIWPYRI